VDLHQVRILVAGVAIWAFWWGALRALGPESFDRAWELAGWGALGALVYAGALLVLGELHRSDRDFLRKVLHPSALLDELKGR
jgi:hypothetical protein